MESSFQSERFQELRGVLGFHFGQSLFNVASTGSTNDDALKAAREGAPHGTVFIADEQTNGRGRRGNTWQSRPGADLLVSILLRPEITPDRASVFALAAGLAVRDTVAPLLELPAFVKWPNDVYVTERKIAGILVESQIQGSAVSALVVGIGINMSAQEFPPEIADRATSLALVGANVTREELLAQLLASLERRYVDYQRHGVTGIAYELNQYDALRGKRICVDSLSGIARGIDNQGRLVLEDDRGARHALISGSVSFDNP